jgi:type VI protein secretion system component VasK
LWLAAENTAVDDPAVQSAFQPVQPAAQAEKPYLSAVSDLQKALTTAGAVAQPSNEVMYQVSDASVRAIAITRSISATFKGGSPGLADAVVRLVSTPLNYAAKLVRGGADLNAKARITLRACDALTKKYPFNSTSQSEAETGEVDEFLNPSTGALGTFYAAYLQDVLARNGDQFVPRSAGVNAEFVRFFNRASAISEGLFAKNHNFEFEPYVQPSVCPLELNFILEAKNFNCSSPQGADVSWSATGYHEVQLIYNHQQYINSHDVWAMFHFFGLAQWTQRAGLYEVTWFKPAVPVAFRVEVTLPVPVLDPKFIGGMSCNYQVLK